MTLLCSTPMRSLFFGIVAFLMLTLGTGSAAQNIQADHQEAFAQSITTLSTSNNLQATPTNCLPDGNEPNENPSQATPSSSFQSPNFHTPQDVDWVRYEAQGGSWHLVESWGFDVTGIQVPLSIEVYSQATNELVANGVSWWDYDNPDTYVISAIWYASTAGSYLVRFGFPSAAMGLHTCGVGQYSASFRTLDWPSATGVFSVRGMVFHDDNWSKDWQVDESPIANVTVTLRGATDIVVGSYTTTQDGIFRFDNLPPGQYVVEEQDPEAHISSTSNRVIVALRRDEVIYFGDFHFPSRSGSQFLPLQLKQR